jgi:hypothetical protein
MKKILLFLLTLFAFSNAEAQSSYETQYGDTSVSFYDYSSGNPGMKVYNNVRIVSGFSDRSLQWRHVSHSFPSSWTVEGFCDNLACYSMSTIGNNMWRSTDLVTSAYSDFHLSFLNTPTNGTAIMQIEVRDTAVPGSNRTLTFIASKTPQGITTTVRSEESIKVYPNPARESVNVIFNADNNVKTISVYNLLGQPVSVFHVAGNSANLPLGDAPAGVYFLRMYDAQGRIVATRRFTRQ